MRLILSLILIGNVALAQDAVYLGKDEKAPFDGYLSTPKTIKDLYNVKLEKDSLQRQLDISQKNNDLSEKKVDKLMTQMDKLAQTAYSSQSLSTWEKIGYIAIGVGIVSLGAYVAKEAAKP